MHSQDLNARHFENKMVQVLRECGINLEDCTVQTYDRASVMSAVNQGTQKQAAYIPYFNHNYNSVIMKC